MIDSVIMIGLYPRLPRRKTSIVWGKVSVFNYTKKYNSFVKSSIIADFVLSSTNATVFDFGIELRFPLKLLSVKTSVCEYNMGKITEFDC